MVRLIVLSCLMFAALASCGTDVTLTPAEQNGPNDQQNIYLITVDSNSGEFHAELPDGTIFNNATDYEREMPAIAAKAMQDGYRVELKLGENVSRELDDALGPAQPVPTNHDTNGVRHAYLVLHISDYTLSTGPAVYGRAFGGCISGPTDIEYSIRLNRGDPGRQVFDVHLAKYRRAGRTCFGAYESVARYVDLCSCPSSYYEAIRDAVYRAAIAAGVSATVAYVIATAAAPVGVAALAF